MKAEQTRQVFKELRVNNFCPMDRNTSICRNEKFNCFEKNLHQLELKVIMALVDMKIPSFPNYLQAGSKLRRLLSYQIGHVP